MYCSRKCFPNLNLLASLPQADNMDILSQDGLQQGKRKRKYWSEGQPQPEMTAKACYCKITWKLDRDYLLSWRSRAFASYSENPNLTQISPQLLLVLANEAGSPASVKQCCTWRVNLL